jgi:hypothetical protein
MLQMGVAKEIGCTLAELKSKMTMEELMLWSAWFELQHDEMQKRR